jgi:hypothetical protein
MPHQLPSKLKSGHVKMVVIGFALHTNDGSVPYVLPSQPRDGSETEANLSIQIRGVDVMDNACRGR